MSDVNGTETQAEPVDNEAVEADFEEAVDEAAPPKPQPRSKASQELMAIKAGGTVTAIIPRGIDEAFRLAQLVVAARLAPAGLESPEKVLVAILHGAEIGLPPMQALQGIAVINGRPSIYGSVAMALIQKSNVFAELREWLDGEDDARTAHCYVRRHNDVEGKEFTFSVADAKVAKLWGKKTRNGGDTPWITHPDRMLLARARGYAFRDKSADVLHGLFLYEEAVDMEPIEQVDLTPQPPTGSGLRNRLPGPQATGFDPSHIEREINGDSLAEDLKASVEAEKPAVADDAEAAFLVELAALLKDAKTEIEVGAIAMTSAEQRKSMSAEGQAAAEKLIEDRREALTKPKGKRK